MKRQGIDILLTAPLAALTIVFLGAVGPATESFIAPTTAKAEALPRALPQFVCTVRAYGGAVKGGGKVRRVADQNCGTPALCTPPDTGCQLFPIHFFDPSSGPGSCGSVGALGSGWEPPGWSRCCASRSR